MITQGVTKLVFVDSKMTFENGQLFKLYNEKWKSTCSITNLKIDDFSVKNVEKLLRSIGKAELLGGVFDFSQFEVRHVIPAVQVRKSISKRRIIDYRR